VIVISMSRVPKGTRLFLWARERLRDAWRIAACPSVRGSFRAPIWSL